MYGLGIYGIIRDRMATTSCCRR